MRHHVVFGAAALSSLFIQTVVAGPIALGIFLAVPVAISLISTGLGIGCANADKDDVGTDRDSNNCRKGKRSLQDLQMERDAELWAANMTESVKRDGLNLPGVPQFVRDQCMAEVTKTTIVVTGPIGNNGIRIDGVPPTCMTLATVLVGDPVNGPYPIPMGSAALQYNDLTLEQYNQLRALFKQRSTA